MRARMGRLCECFLTLCMENGIQKTNMCYSKMYASFGGLLMFLEGPYRKLTALRVDDVYLLIKK